jgi:thioredoxin-like negative regulator of GroEL
LKIMTGKVIDVAGWDVAAVIAEQRGLILFDLWSPTCAPCRALAPILDDLAADFVDELRICKVNVAVDEAIAKPFAARTLPTLALYRDGVEIDRVVGLKSRGHLTAWLESHL